MSGLVGLRVTVEFDLENMTDIETFDKEFHTDPYKLLQEFIDCSGIEEIVMNGDNYETKKVTYYFHD